MKLFGCAIVLHDPKKGSGEPCALYAIETQKLTKTYGKIAALDGVDLCVEPGEAFGLLGPNGAGKTTLISIMSTLIRATSGRAFLCGLDVAREEISVRRRIGIVFQDPSLDEKLTARENLLLHCSLYAMPMHKRAERVNWALDLVELAPRQHDLVRKYSGGMRRRLEIARSLLHTPEVLFLDEPTLGLDPQTRDHIWVYLERLREQGITTMLTTHYMDEADRLCSRIAIIDNGRIVVTDTPSKLKKNLGDNLVTLFTDNPGVLLDALNGELRDSARTLADRLVLNVSRPGPALAQVFRTAADHNIDIKSVNIAQPTLNDVFLKFTGRDLREERFSMNDRSFAHYTRSRRR